MLITLWFWAELWQKPEIDLSERLPYRSSIYVSQPLLVYLESFCYEGGHPHVELCWIGAYTNAWANWRVAEPQKSRVKPCAGGCGARMGRNNSNNSMLEATTPPTDPHHQRTAPPPHHGHLHVDRLVVWAFLWLLGWVPRSHPWFAIPLPAW